MTESVTPETIRTLASLVGIEVPQKDEERLAAALGGHLAAIDGLARQLDLEHVDPAVHFDPRWS